MANNSFSIWELSDFGLTYGNAVGGTPTVSFAGVSAQTLTISDDDTVFDDPHTDPFFGPSPEPGVAQTAVDGPIPGAVVDAVTAENVIDSNGNFVGKIHYFAIDDDGGTTSGDAHGDDTPLHFALDFVPDPSETYTLGNGPLQIDGSANYADLVTVAPAGTDVTFFDMIEVDGRPSAGDVYTHAGGDLIEVDEPVVFTLANAAVVAQGDTALIDGVTWTITSAGYIQQNVTADNGTNFVAQGRHIELSDGAGGTLNYVSFNHNDPVGTEFTNITVIEFTTSPGENFLISQDFQQDDNVTLPSAAATVDTVPIYDMILSNAGFPQAGDTLTVADGDLVSLQDGLVFTGPDANGIDVGHTTVIGGVTYTVNDTYDQIPTVIFDDGLSTQSSGRWHTFDLSDGTNTISLHVPQDGWGDYPNITEMTFPANAGNDGSVNVANLDLDNNVTLATIVGPNFIVEGDANANTIDDLYLGDPEGDLIDNNDHSDFSNNDSVEAGGGDDTVRALDGEDTVHGGTGNDELFGNAGNDLVFGDAGNDSLIGSAGLDTLNGGDGDDSVAVGDGSESDTIIGGETGETAGDVLDGSYMTTDNTVTLTGDEAGTLVHAGGTHTFSEIENVVTGSGNDTIDGGSNTADMNFTTNDGNDSLHTGVGNDAVNAGAGNDTIISGEGNDTVYGGEGNDEIYGSKDNDESYGEGGDDLFGVGNTSASDTIVGGETGETLGDTLDAGLMNDATTTVLTGNGVGTMTHATGVHTFSEIENIITGAGNDTVEANGIASDMNYVLNGGDDSIRAGEGNNVIDAGAGNDYIHAGLGNDEVSGGTGNDSFVGAQGDDTLHGGDGNDDIIGSQGNDSTFGDSGDDRFGVGSTSGSDTIVGGETAEIGGDTMDAGLMTAASTTIFTGNEAGTMTHADGVHTFSEIENVMTGSGDDTVDASATTSGIALDTGAGADSVTGGSGADTISTGDGEDVIAAGAGDVVDGGAGGVDDDTLDLRGLGNYQIVGETTDADGNSTSGTVEFLDAGGAVTGSMTFTEIENIIGDGAGPDYIVYGTTGNDTIEAGNYVDITDGDEVDNNDALNGSNDDVIFGLEGDDFIRSGDGDDSTNGNIGEDTIYGDAGNDTLYGGQNNDEIRGGAGNDEIYGGQGDDAIYVGDFSESDTISGTETTETFGDTLIAEAMTSDVTVNMTGDEAGTLTHAGGVHTFSEIENIETGSGNDIIDGFAENSGMNYTTNDGTDSIVTGSGDDLIVAGADNDTVFAGKGEDTISGGTGDDSLTGNAGDDSISSGLGNDFVNGGHGNDSINAGAGADSVIGNTGDDTIHGGTGDDTLDGGIEDDSIVGGSGSDDILGGGGSDTITGDGLEAPTELVVNGDFVDGFEGFSRVGNVSWEDTELFGGQGGQGRGLLFNSGDSAANGIAYQAIVTQPGEQVTVSVDYGFRGIATTDHTLEVELVDADGVVLGSQTVVVTGTSGTITFSGVATTDTTELRISNPSVSDTDDSDLIVDNVSITVAPSLISVDGNDDIDAGAGDDVVEGNGGNDTIDGGYGSDLLQGGTGNDVINGEFAGATDPGAGTIITNNFDNDAEGWQVYQTAGDVNGTGDTGTYVASGGNSPDEADPNGYLAYEDIESGLGNYYAPSAYLGDQSDKLGGTFKYSLTMEAGETVGQEFDAPNLYITGANGVTITANLENPEQGEWTEHEISMAEGDWIISGSGGVYATDVEIAAVLADVSSLYINGEHFGGSDGGGDISGLDTISWTPPTFDDTIEGGAGDDIIDGGVGADDISGGDDADTFAGGAADTIDGGTGGNDDDTLNVEAGWTFANWTTDADGDSFSGALTNGTETIQFSEIENFNIDGNPEAPGVTLHDVILVDGTLTTTMTVADGDLLSVTDGVVFNTSNSNEVVANDTFVLNGVEYTVTSVSGFDASVDYDGGSNNPDANFNAIVGEDAAGNEVTIMSPNDLEGDLPLITSIEILAGAPQSSVPIAEMNGNENVTLAPAPTESAPIHDAILINSGTPGLGDTLTAPGGDLVKVVEPLVFSGGTAENIENGDTVVIDGVTYTVSQVNIVQTNVTFDDGASSTTAPVVTVELTDGTNTISLLLPIDEALDLPDITEIEVTSVEAPASAEVTLVDQNQDVSLAEPTVDTPLMFDLILSNDPIPGAGSMLTVAGGDLVDVIDGVTFNGPNAQFIEVGDTTVIGGVTYTINEIQSHNADIFVEGLGFSQEERVYGIEMSDGTNTITYYAVHDTAPDMPNITQIQLDTTPSFPTNFQAVDVGPLNTGLDDDDVVTLASLSTVVPYYDFIQLNDPSIAGGTTSTTAAGELVEIDEPMEFTQSDPNGLTAGDTVEIDGVTWSIADMDAFNSAQFTDDDGTHPVSGFIINLTNAAGDTLTYAVPNDGTKSGPGEDHVNITEITWSTFTKGITIIAGETIDSNDNVTLMTCFVEGSLIKTQRGEIDIADLDVGDKVLTMDNGYQAIRWIGKSKVKAEGNLAPIMIKAGALDNDRDLMVSPLHRMMISDWRAELMYGEDEVLVAAKHLTNGDTIFSKSGGDVTYYHMMFDAHEIVFAEGIPSESFYPGEVALGSLEEEIQEEIFTLFPELRVDLTNYGQSARMELTAREAQVMTARSTS